MSGERLLRDLLAHATNAVERVALMARVFGRVKSQVSLEEKIGRKGYSPAGKRMQDLIGLRVAVYFADDLPVVRELLVRTFGKPVGEVRDSFDQTTFQPIRWNLVFPVPDRMRGEIDQMIRDRPIDPTFEVQLRTVLAEGWHEVEHDLRYKAPHHWDDAPEMSRMFNGILASLETADWSLIQLVERLAYTKYKSKQWDGMLRLKCRLRLSGKLSAAHQNRLDEDHDLARALFRLRRSTLISHLHQLPSMPLTVDNILLLSNRLCAKDCVLIESEPGPIRQMFESLEVSGAARESGTFEAIADDTEKIID